MTNEEEAKIDGGVRECLEVCQTTNRPFYGLKAFIGGLQDDSAWTDKEIIELQTRVIRTLLIRRSTGA